MSAFGLRGRIRPAAIVAAAMAVAGLAGWQVNARAAAPASLTPVIAAKAWLNGEATRSSLRGKVVLVDIFTVDCYNCRNVTPNLRALNTKYSRELQIIGVHSPETPYERDRGTVVGKLKELGVVWPVAIDNDFAIWHAYDTEYWPTQLIFDRNGILRKTIIGDSQDDAVNDEIKSLIAEKT